MKSDAEKIELRLAILEAARALREAAAVCRSRVAGDAGRCWVWRDRGVSAKASSIEIAAWAMTESDYYRDDQKPLDTLCAPGLIEVGADGRAAIERLNAAKAAFQARCAEASHLQAELNGRRLPIATIWLHRNGFSRLNRRQVYRQITVLDRRPAYIGFSWSVTQLVYTLDRAEVERLIMTRVDDDHVRSYLDKLERLPDEVFAQRVPVEAIQPSCNIRFEDGTRKHKKTALPVVVQPGWWPEYREINPHRAPSGKRGREQIIESAPWIAELGVYRYVPGYRQVDEHFQPNTMKREARGNTNGTQADRGNRGSDRNRKVVA